MGANNSLNDEIANETMTDAKKPSWKDNLVIKKKKLLEENERAKDALALRGFP
jgi:hypothetical protein